MNQEQCNDLRDILFSLEFVTTFTEGKFRFLAIVAADAESSETAIHCSYDKPVWKRAGQDVSQENVEATIREKIKETKYSEQKFNVVFHKHLRNGWPISWDLTAKDSFHNSPVLILVENSDKTVFGVLVRDAHLGNAKVNFANEYAEPEEVKSAIQHLRTIDTFQQSERGWYKDKNIDFDSLEDAIKNTPENDAGQKEIFIYKDYGWKSGFWTKSLDGKEAALELEDLCKNNSIRISQVKLSSRHGIEIALENSHIEGEYDLLISAADSINYYDPNNQNNYEEIPAIQKICKWWNENADADFCSARLFRVYIWDDANKTFMPGDPEEPPVEANIFPEIKPYAIFKKDGFPTVALTFFRGKESYEEINGWIITKSVSGEKGWSYGCKLHEVDEAYYSFTGLMLLKYTLADK